MLVVDEAGQLALADAVASANAAKNLILLGDPLQLSQVAQAEHPDGSGASVLEHILGGHATLPEDQGVFISETRRMHPDVCRFISESDLRGTTLQSRVVRAAEHAVRHRASLARGRHIAIARRSRRKRRDLVIAQVSAMIGTPWVNQRGERAPLRAEDFMVVAPYNDQVDLLRATFDRTPGPA